jgi:hypothetical protein
MISRAPLKPLKPLWHKGLRHIDTETSYVCPCPPQRRVLWQSLADRAAGSAIAFHSGHAWRAPALRSPLETVYCTQRQAAGWHQIAALFPSRVLRLRSSSAFCAQQLPGRHIVPPLTETSRVRPASPTGTTQRICFINSESAALRDLPAMGAIADNGEEIVDLLPFKEIVARKRNC